MCHVAASLRKGIKGYAAQMAGMQGYTEHMTTILLYSIFVMLLGSYGAYEHEFHRQSMHSMYAGVRQLLAMMMSSPSAAGSTRSRGYW